MNEDEVATCTHGSVLVVADGRLGCLPPPPDAPRCALDEAFVSPSCRRVRNPAGLFDLAVWTQAFVDGLCPALEGSPLAFRPEPIDVAVRVRVPGNDLSLSSIEGVGVDHDAGRWMRIFAPYLDVLRAFGGQATAAVAEGRVRCASRVLLPRPEPVEVVGDP